MADESIAGDPSWDVPAKYFRSAPGEAVVPYVRHDRSARTTNPCSGTITAGGTPQQFAAANPARTGFWIQNQSTGDLWLMIGSNAAASQPALRIPAGMYYTSEPEAQGTGAISVFGAVTGQAFAGREW